MRMPVPNKDFVDLWYRYEEIAMHFNSLLIQFRLQLLGGIGAIGTVGGYLVGSKTQDRKEQAQLRLLVSAALLLLVVAAATIDLFYYNRLLRGAVDVIIDLEKKTNSLYMSRHIEDRVAGGEWAIWWCYVLIVTVLSGFTWWSWGRYRAHR
jgi:hypothetical protein